MPPINWTTVSYSQLPKWRFRKCLTFSVSDKTSRAPLLATFRIGYSNGFADAGPSLSGALMTRPPSMLRNYGWVQSYGGSAGKKAAFFGGRLLVSSARMGSRSVEADSVDGDSREWFESDHILEAA